MRILCVIQRFFPVIGGAENHAKFFLDYLSKDHDVTVYTTNADDLHSFWNKKSKKIESNSISSYKIKRFEFLTPEELHSDKSSKNILSSSNHPGPFSPDLWTELLLKKPKFDLIFVISYPYDHVIPTYLSSKKWGIPIIITPLIHQEFPDLFLNGMRLTMLKNADAITVSTNSERNILTKYNIDSKKIFIIPPGINPQNEIIYDPQIFKKKNSLPPQTKIILFVGNKSKSKGVFFLIESMKKLWKVIPDIVLVLIGSDTPEFTDYLSKQSKETIRHIINLGVVEEDEKNLAYSACDVFVLPSISESFGIVYLEAWSHSKPVIGCKIESTLEIIKHGEDGLVVKYDDIQNLSDSIRYLLENDNIRQKFGKEGKEKTRNFLWPDLCRKFEMLCMSTTKNFKHFD